MIVVPDPSFEADGDGWALSGQAGVIEEPEEDLPDNHAHTGTKYLALTFFNVDHLAGDSLAEVPIACDTGKGVRVTFWANLRAATSVFDALFLQINGSTVDKIYPYRVVNSGQWVQLEYIFTPQADEFTLGFMVVAPIVGTGRWDIDDVAVDSLTRPIPYPENTHGPIRFRRGLIDDVYGTLYKDDEVVLDRQGRIRQKGDVDAPNHDELTEWWGAPRRERTEPEP